MKTKITKLFNIKYPIIQGGMIWCSGWELAAAVSKAGGLGLIGAGSMYPDILREHIIKLKKATNKTFGVNLPLLYPQVDEHIQIILDEKVPVVFTSAGNPKKYTAYLKSRGVKVVHVVANSKFALKCVEAGVDAIVAEGFEAGGHNGHEETTTLTLIPALRPMFDIPLIAAGGIGSGRAMLAAMALGADAVQIGSRFVASTESSAHINFKLKVLEAKDGDTKLSLKELVPVRLLKNRFLEEVEMAYHHKANKKDLENLLGHGRAKRGMFEGDLEEGELEIGQVSASIHDIIPADEIIQEMIADYRKALKNMPIL
jgi:enoyl-[acyl-carrier protein] reductase II